MFSMFPNNKNKLVNKNGFDLVLIIDRSGSMSGTERNIIAGHNALVESLKRVSKKITLTTILFDDDIVIKCDGKRLTEIKKFDYYLGGTTALYDAWGTAIIHENKRKEDKNNPFPDADVLYLTVTDGEENDSKIFTMEKIREKMIQEKRRSLEGHGVREFAMIREFGIDAEQLEKDLKFGKHKSQIFYRSNEGIEVLFKIIAFAAEEMVEYRRITEKWITKSDNLKIGNYTLKQIKAMTKDKHRLLANLEKIYMELLLAADEGLTDEFWAMYKKYDKLAKKMEQTGVLETGDEEIDSILNLYIYKNETNLKMALLHAKDAMVDKAAARCETYLGKIREITDNKQANIKGLLSAINKYKDSVKRFDLLPAYYPELKVMRITDRISGLIYELEKRYIKNLTDIFKVFTVLLKTAFGTDDLIEFNRLAGLAKETYSPLFDGVPEYKEFCHWVEVFNKEIESQEEKKSA